MIQFLFAAILGVFAIAAGLAVLHRATTECPAKLLKASGWVLVSGGIVLGAFTLLYSFKHQSRGDFDDTHMGQPGMMHDRGNGMGPQ